MGEQVEFCHVTVFGYRTVNEDSDGFSYEVNVKK